MIQNTLKYNLYLLFKQRISQYFSFPIPRRPQTMITEKILPLTVRIVVCESWKEDYMVAIPCIFTAHPMWCFKFKLRGRDFLKNIFILKY
jgi:hypothetical protein